MRLAVATRQGISARRATAAPWRGASARREGEAAWQGASARREVAPVAAATVKSTVQRCSQLLPPATDHKIHGGGGLYGDARQGRCWCGREATPLTMAVGGRVVSSGEALRDSGDFPSLAGVMVPAASLSGAHEGMYNATLNLRR
jgi:hypothetical protein